MQVAGLTWRYICQEFDGEEGRLGALHSDLPYSGTGIIAGYIIVEQSKEDKKQSKIDKPTCEVSWWPYIRDADSKPKVKAGLTRGQGYYTSDLVGDVFVHQTHVESKVVRKWALVIGTVSKYKADKINFDARKLRFGSDLHWHRDENSDVVSGAGSEENMVSLQVCTPSY